MDHLLKETFFRLMLFKLLFGIIRNYIINRDHDLNDPYDHRCARVHITNYPYAQVHMVQMEGYESVPQFPLVLGFPLTLGLKKRDAL